MTSLAAVEWRYLRVAITVLAAVIALDLAAWKVRDLTTSKPTRLDRVVRCLTNEKNAPPVVPAGSPLADNATAGSLRTTIEGNEVTVALASTEVEAEQIEALYRRVAGPLAGRLERRGLTVYLWRFVSSPTQRQAMYDCQY